MSMRLILKLAWGLLMVLLLTQCKSDTKAVAKTAATGDPAYDQLSELIAKSPEDHRLLYERAQLQYKNGEYDQVISDLNKAIALDSLVPEYYHLMSDAHLDYYRSKDALLLMEKAGDIFPKRIPTLLKLSETQLILKQNEESLLTVARILTIDPQNAEGHFMTGMNFRAIGEIDRAINAFQKATELDPEITDAWLILGQLFESKDDKRAVDFYEAAINSDSDNPKTWHSKAYYLQNNGQEDKAIELYRKIIEIDKNYLDAYLNAGILYMEKKNYQSAMEQFDIMANVKTQDHRAYYYRGLCYEKLGNIAAARADFQNCLNLNPDFDRARKAMMDLDAS